MVNHSMSEIDIGFFSEPHDRLLLAKEIGYSKILLDSAKFIQEAYSLYQSVGFREVEIYSETKMTENFQEHMVYMELEL